MKPSMTLVALVWNFSTVCFLKRSGRDDKCVLLCIWAGRDKLLSQWLGRLFLNCCEASSKRLYSSQSSTSNCEICLLRRNLIFVQKINLTWNEEEECALPRQPVVTFSKETYSRTTLAKISSFTPCFLSLYFHISSFVFLKWMKE